jgi:hypothetical protein
MAGKRFDFKTFARDHQVTKLISELADIVSLEGDAEARRGEVEKFKKRFKIEIESDPKPDFHFDVTEDTYEKTLRECVEQGVNLRRVTFIQGDRVFVERELRPDGDQRWKEVASPSSVDIHQETAQLSFLDSEKKCVDWSTTLNNLNKMIKSKPYSEDMLKTCLLRFINHYESQQTEYLKDKTCDQIANFLLSLNSRIDKKAFHKSKLQNSVRKPDETLSAALFKVKNIAEQIYPPGEDAEDHEVSPMVNRILINAIISFVRDEIAIPLLEKVQEDSSLSRLMDYNEYLNMAMNAELRSQMYPTVPLKYSRKITPSQSSILTLNSIELPEIHPCMKLPPKKGAFPKTLENYFGQLQQTSPDDIAHVVRNFGDGATNTDPILTQHLSFNPIRPDAFQTVPGPNIAFPTSNVTPVGKQKFMKREHLPTDINLFTGPSGPFFYVNNEKIYVIDSAEDSLADSQKTLPESQTKEPKNPKPEEKSAKGKQSESESSTHPTSSSNQENDTEPIYTELLSMMLKNLMKPNSKANDGQNRDNHPSNHYSKDSSGPNQYRNNYPSKDRYYHDDRRDFDDKPQSYYYENRDQERGRPQDRYDSSYHRDSRYDSRGRYSRERSNSWNGGRSRYRSPYRTNTPIRRDISRDRSREARRAQRIEDVTSKQYPNMKKGSNCSPDYNPFINKKCTKCANKVMHHEFECKIYDAWSSKRCNLCDLYNHFAKDCKEIERFPPKHADSNSINTTPNN